MAQLSGLLRSAFAQPDLHAVLDADLHPAETPALRVEGPAALRPFLAAALAGDDGANRTVLAVTATDREAEDLARPRPISSTRARRGRPPQLGDPSARAPLTAPGHGGPQAHPVPPPGHR